MSTKGRKSRKGTARKGDLTRRDFLRAASVAVSAQLLAGQEPSGTAPAGGTLRVEIRDAATKQIVPAMVCITSLADRKWRTPPDGRTAPPYTTHHDFYEGLPSWKPGDIGPVRVTNGLYGGNDPRSFVYADKSSYPFWQEPATYFVSKPFEISLPAGKWRLAVARGIEYYPVFEEFEMTGGGTRERPILLRRWVDMAKSGWYSGDDHIHMVRMTPAQNEFLMTWALAEDVHVSNTLRVGDIKQVTFEQAGYGKNARYQKGDYALVSGQEDPRMDIHEQGHAIALNIQAPVRDVSRYHLYDWVFDHVHEQGGLTGYAHVAWAIQFYRSQREETFATWDSTINVPRDKVDFMEILQFRLLGLEDYYDFLNLGYKLTASAGSDIPWGNTIGEVRMYVYTGPQFSADAWFAEMKKGRTFVTNGPMVELTVNGTGLGDEVKVGKNARLRIRARAWAPADIGSPKTLEIVAHGQVIRSVESHDRNTQELKIDFSLKAEASQWIAARVTSHNGALAHTSPVYVVVEGQSFRDQKELPKLVEKRLKVLDYIAGRLHDPKLVEKDHCSPSEVEALLADIEEARARYKQLLVST
jgi:hypothetical protein